MIPPLLSYAPFLFCFLCPLRFPFFKFFLPLRAFEEFLNFWKQTAGKGFYLMLGDIYVWLLFCHISPFLFSCQGTMPHRGGVKFCLYAITFPLCIAVAALLPPARPAGYGQPVFECSAIRFPASPVPCGLSFCRFRWLLPLLPTFDFLPKGLLS